MDAEPTAGSVTATATARRRVRRVYHTTEPRLSAPKSPRSADWRRRALRSAPRSRSTVVAAATAGSLSVTGARMYLTSRP